ncbi:MAG: hypothetical protein GY866_31115 [Proteobacteria bacterium]|nr:hypothetical protein [Pseudomonadota bacterium]
MPNITLSVDEEVVKKVRKIAVDKNTTLTALVREYLTSLAERDEMEKEMSINRLKNSFAIHARSMGKRRWKRADLYER